MEPVLSFKACPSRAKAHEVVSGGSYSASKRTQSLSPRRLKYKRPTDHLSTRVKTPLHLVRAGGRQVNAERRSTTTREGLSLVGAPPPQSSVGNDQEANPTAHGQRLLSISPTSVNGQSHLQPEAFQFPGRVTHSKALQDTRQINCTQPVRYSCFRTWNDPGSGG